MHNTKLFYVWMAFCAIVGIAFWSITFWLIGQAVLGHEIEHQHPENAVPSPPPTAGIEECLENHKEAVLDRTYYSDREFAYENVLKPCIFDADEDHQYKELIRQMFAQQGIML